ncbi:MAG: DUF4389 domain-containing protein [Alphaproteobacteria bacterium]|nr:DUF4389 domain-containing protein [Alphaproteobacteria bacterium]
MEENGLDADVGEIGVLDHVKNTDTWLRLVFMFLFAVVFQITKWVVFLIAAVQFVFKALTGQTHPRIQALGTSLGAYLREMTEFLTFASEQKPYPWGDWPSQQEQAAPAKAAVSKGTRSRKKAAGARKSKKADDEEKS